MWKNLGWPMTSTFPSSKRKWPLFNFWSVFLEIFLRVSAYCFLFLVSNNSKKKDFSPKKRPYELSSDEVGPGGSFKLDYRLWNARRALHQSIRIGQSWALFSLRVHLGKVIGLGVLRQWIKIGRQSIRLGYRRKNTRVTKKTAIVFSNTLR